MAHAKRQAIENMLRLWYFWIATEDLVYGLGAEIGESRNHDFIRPHDSVVMRKPSPNI